MESFIRLILLSIGMFFGALLAGVLPFRLGLADSRRNLSSQRWTVLGSGLLVGAVLTVIIPEGMEAMYSGKSSTASTLLGVPWHSWIGPTLAFGFSFMLLVDQAASMPKRRPRASSTASTGSECDGATPNQYPGAESRTSSATLGLLVHAAADGVAMGAASTTNSNQLELVIFAAVLLHKAPTAFGLSTVLLRERYTRAQVLQRLLAFSVAAPIGALLTYGVLLASFMAAGIYKDHDGLTPDQLTRLNRLTGLLLLFSQALSWAFHKHGTSTAEIINPDDRFYSAEEEEEDGDNEEDGEEEEPSTSGDNGAQGDTDEEILLQERITTPFEVNQHEIHFPNTQQYGITETAASPSTNIPTITAKKLSGMLNTLASPRRSTKHPRRWPRQSKVNQARRMRANSRAMLSPSTHTPRDTWSLIAFLVGVFIPALFSIGHHH
ncbi:ZIP zinc transporter-domain-containing protein [Syncephalis fuscata]|nr:ZIP zinc transporter-domain-containing protein [Syncephalis fuscata]